MAQDLKFPVGEGAFNWDSYKAFDEATNLDGQTLTIFGPWRGEDQVLVESMLAYFEAASGVDVSYSSSEGYEQQIIIDAEALLAQKRRLDAAAFLKRSDELGVDQRLLRLRYGQFVGMEAEETPKASGRRTM